MRSEGDIGICGKHHRVQMINIIQSYAYIQTDF